MIMGMEQSNFFMPFSRIHIYDEEYDEYYCNDPDCDCYKDNEDENNEEIEVEIEEILCQIKQNLLVL